MCVTVCLFVCLVAILEVDTSGFHYESTTYQRLESCRICFEAVCWPMDHTHCDYFTRADAVMEGDEDMGDVTVADGMVYDMMMEVDQSLGYQECVPFVSEYTNCHKDNICTGCNVCSCDSEGRWQCGEVARCSRTDELVVDRKILNNVIDNMINNKNRKKRSFVATDKINITEDIDWMYDMNNTENDDINNKKILNNVAVKHVINKREIHNTLNATEATIHNLTAVSLVELRSNVLLPLIDIIDVKERELNDLSKIKEHLITFIESLNKTNLIDIVNKSQVYSVYNINVNSEEFNLRKINSDNLSKLLYKLKIDITEVIKDIVTYKKLTKNKELPEDFKMLVSAMKYYLQNKNNDKKFSRTNTNMKTKLIDILKFLNINMTDDILTPLAMPVKKILKRVILNNFIDEFSGFNVYSSDYNLTNNLRTIGKDWVNVVKKFEECQITERLYCIKLVHITLSDDITKIEHVLTLISYAQSRRMMPIEETLGENLTEKISASLLNINNKIKQIIHIKNGLESNKNKKSLFKKIKSLLKKSKKEIKKLVNKGVPKDEIVKKIANNNLDGRRLNDYNTMLKWQNELHVVKRSLNHYKDRMKNIIPNYLRGKVQNTKTKMQGGKKKNNNDN